MEQIADVDEEQIKRTGRVVSQEPELIRLDSTDEGVEGELMVGSTRLIQSGIGAGKQLVNDETGDPVVSSTHHNFEAYWFDGDVLFVGQTGATKTLYGSDGDTRMTVGHDFGVTEIAGTTYFTTQTGANTYIVGAETGEKLTNGHHRYAIDGRTVVGFDGAQCTEYEFEADVLWAIEHEDDESFELPDVTEEVEAVCDRYIENDDMWVTDLEHELEAAMS